MYKAIYKCRMCGEVYSKYYYDTKGEAKNVMDSVMREKTESPFLMREHDCHDGSIGYADFVGFRKENDK